MTPLTPIEIAKYGADIQRLVDNKVIKPMIMDDGQFYFRLNMDMPKPIVSVDPEPEEFDWWPWMFANKVMKRLGYMSQEKEDHLDTIDDDWREFDEEEEQIWKVNTEEKWRSAIKPVMDEKGFGGAVQWLEKFFVEFSKL